MVSDNAQPHPSGSDSPESDLRFGMMLAEIWHDWFEAISEVAYEMHRTCEFLAENGGPSSGRYGPFRCRPSRSPYGGLAGSIDMDTLRQCLQSMDPMQAAKVMHAVQTIQAMEAMLKRQRSRANGAEEAAWQGVEW
jgi:hypothetical protein